MPTYKHAATLFYFFIAANSAQKKQQQNLSWKFFIFVLQGIFGKFPSVRNYPHTWNVWEEKYDPLHILKSSNIYGYCVGKVKWKNSNHFKFWYCLYSAFSPFFFKAEHDALILRINVQTRNFVVLYRQSFWFFGEWSENAWIWNLISWYILPRVREKAWELDVKIPSPIICSTWQAALEIKGLNSNPSSKVAKIRV